MKKISARNCFDRVVSVLMSLTIILFIAACADNDAKRMQDHANELRQKVEAERKMLGSGGQPGVIRLIGPFHDQNQNLVPQIKIEQISGTNLDGTRNPVAADHVMTKESDSKEESLLTGISDNESIISLGCSDEFVSQYQNENGQPLAVVDPLLVGTDDELVLKAKKILVCGNPQLLDKYVVFYADTLVFSDAHVSTSYFSAQLLHLHTHQLVLLGESEIRSLASNLSPDLADADKGPRQEVKIAAAAVSGSGHLLIHQEGFNQSHVQ